VAHADLYSAQQAYDNKDFNKAFELYRELAELGQMNAQENLALMYVAGEGVTRNNLLGYAWASIALENGGGESMRAIVAQLEPHITEKSRLQINELKARFGREGLRKALLPDIFANASYIDREPCRILKGIPSRYPDHAFRSGIQGNAYVEVTVMPDGSGRNPRVIYAVPAGEFEEAARETALKTRYTPARTRKGALVPCTMAFLVRYEISGNNATDYPRLDNFVEQTHVKAEAGDPRAQMLYGLLLSGVPQLKKTRSDAMPWFLKSAQAGMPSAQFAVGYSIMQGWGCQCEEPKGLVWLHKAAAADQSDAQVALANYLLRDEPGPEEVAKAMKWLERAVASGNREAKFYLAALLAAGPDPTPRDPARAMNLLKQVMRDVDVDPTAFEIRAAAQAMAGDFKAALADQGRALRMAQRLEWEVASQESRLKAYETGKPWTGDLFAF
jgi:TonB family protein